MEDDIEKMTVFVVFMTPGKYESTFMIDVFTTEERAERYIAEQRKPGWYHYETWAVRDE